MDNLIASCDRAKTFPRNIEPRKLSSYNQTLYKQLDSEAERLFSDEEDCSLDFLELSSKGKGT